ncbi:MAG TPA: TolC family protein [Bacteroidales bacterium]|nr:TolC family protein [Bacteroidales bacterium]
MNIIGKIGAPLLLLIFISFSTQGQDTTNLTLEGAIDKALENNYGIITTRKNQAISELNNTWGNAGALPTVRFVGRGSNSRSFNDTDNSTSRQISGTVEMNWTIFRGYSVRIQKERLEEVEKLSEGNLAVVVENTIYNVILSYYNILLSQEQLDIARTNMELSRDRYQRAKHSKEIGTTVTYDLLQAQNAYLRDSSDYLSARSSYRNAMRELNYLMAEPLDNIYSFTSGFQPDTSDFAYSNLVDKMLENNKTLRNQYMNLELARLDVRSARSAYYPTLSLNASGGYSDTETDYDNMSQLDQSRSGADASIGLSLSYTIYDGNNRKRALKAAKIEKEISQVETQEMKQDLKNQLAQEYELYKVRKQLLQVADENLNAAELNLELSREKFENGTINSFNFRDVQQIYQDAAYNYQRAVFNVIQSYHTLMRLTGGIIEEYEEQ